MTAIRLEDVTKIFHGVAATGVRIPVAERNKSVNSAFTKRAAAKAESMQNQYPDSVLALDHVDLFVMHGQTMAVIGPSGCGKSTLLRVMAGLEKDFTGHVYYDNRDMRNILPKDRHIGMVFQNYALYPHFEGHGNLAFYFKLRHTPDKETEEKIRITSEIMGVGFKELLKHKPGVLSGGEQQRVAIGRAIVRTPRIFLLDEPLSNLDAQLRVKTRGDLKRLLKQFSITSVYVTHDQVEAVALADRIAVMREGRIEQVGTYNWLREDPHNAFVAGFVGIPPMNLFSGAVADGRLFLGQIAAPLPDRIRAHVRSGRKITLGVRPEEAQLVTEGQPLPEGLQWRGTVEAIEPDFAHNNQLLHLRSGNYSFGAIVTMDVPLRIGDAAEVIFPMDKIYFFDGDTEERIR
jgi:ABC-type sugar transport system ATPase subunit